MIKLICWLIILVCTLANGITFMIATHSIDKEKREIKRELDRIREKT